VNCEKWEIHTGLDQRCELLNEVSFSGELEIDRVLIRLLYSAGLKLLLEILSKESVEELRKLLTKL
jgi:hypothetical protein